MTAASTPTAEAPSSRSLPRVKDRNCPFCNQAFTSSSLGRHLDLYIREKNPKAPDGVHNVEEIRRMRQGITRRLMRGSRREGSISGTVVADDGPGSDDASSVHEDPILKTRRPGQTRVITLNEPSWQVTGVINNLPPRQATELKPGSSHAKLKSDLGQRQRILEELDSGRAAELALREVLKRMREASARSIGRDVFDFDPYTMSFPSLCLHILPSPTTLFSPTPFPSSESWSIGPPGQKQFDALNKAINDRITLSEVQHVQKIQPGTNQSSSPAVLPPSPTHEQHVKLFNHVSDAYSHWKCLSEHIRQETWQLEVLRSYSRAEEARLKAETELVATKEALERLKSDAECVGPWIAAGNMNQKDNLSRLWSLKPSAFPHLPPDVLKNIWSAGDCDIQNWDFDSLLSKWKERVKAERQQTSGLSAQRSLSVASSQQRESQRNSSQMSDIATSRINNVAQGTSAANYAAPFWTSTSTQPPPQTDMNSTDSGDVLDDDASGDSDPEGDTDVHMQETPITPHFPLQQTQPNQQPQHHHQQAHLSPNPNIQHTHHLAQQPNRTPSPNLTKTRVKQHVPSPLHPQPPPQQQFNAQTAQMTVPQASWQAHAQHMGMQQGFDGVPEAYMGINLAHAHALAGMNSLQRIGEGAGGS